ncbi:hypothetical protein [Hyphobacterium sp.]|uniref:hypothetical protein n=1 Tax=Hyphobacterium sp. TaxID=2004662 RepID=UPI003747A6A5
MTDQSELYAKPSPNWRYSVTVSVAEATLLMLEIEPQEFSHGVEGSASSQYPPDYLATRNVLVTAIENGQLDGTLRYEDMSGVYGAPEDHDIIDYHASNIDMAALRTWLSERGFSNSLSARSNSQGPQYMDRKHRRRSVKLIAAVEAWEAFDEQPNASGSVKQRITNWLWEHAVRLELINKHGEPSDTMIRDVAKLTNWKPGGGAPKK